jgi:hypothetical protein
MRGNIIKAWLQDILEQEVTEVLGRRKHKHKIPDSDQAEDRNGHGKPPAVYLQAGDG